MPPTAKPAALSGVSDEAGAAVPLDSEAEVVVASVSSSSSSSSSFPAIASAVTPVAFLHGSNFNAALVSTTSAHYPLH